MQLEVAVEGRLARQAAWLDRYDFRPRQTEVGVVASVGDGIAWLTGLPSAAINELIHFSEGSEGFVFHLERERVGVVLVHQDPAFAAGVRGYLTGREISIPSGSEMLGRVVDSRGVAQDGKDAPNCTDWMPLEADSPGFLRRDFVHEPLYTGIKSIDTMLPIGRGQRQLIVGDEGLGRSSIALDTVINQKGHGVICVYVLIGQKKSAAVSVLRTLEKFGASDHTVVVVAEASTLPGLIYLAPFAGCAIAEGFMARGNHTLIVYDDLSTHARAYRELSLLFRRPPGREAYPGDIFYLHARLLERATCLNPASGASSMTALPIAETQQGEIATYIPTNLISITDGQIILDRSLFAAGFRPAIDISRSVSRIGGKAQHPKIKTEAGRMKLDYLQFLELEVFTRFGARLEPTMKLQLKRGQVLRQILRQERHAPLSPEFQLAWMIAFNDGLLDHVEPSGLAELLERLRLSLVESSLTLDGGREQWVSWLTGLLDSKP
jgi:F-type H+/Na+-transporting ATPase subunit alpha